MLFANKTKKVDPQSADPTLADFKSEYPELHSQMVTEISAKAVEDFKNIEMRSTAIVQLLSKAGIEGDAAKAYLDSSMSAESIALDIMMKGIAVTAPVPTASMEFNTEVKTDSGVPEVKKYADFNSAVAGIKLDSSCSYGEARAIAINMYSDLYSTMTGIKVSPDTKGE